MTVVSVWAFLPLLIWGVIDGLSQEFEPLTVSLGVFVYSLWFAFPVVAGVAVSAVVMKLLRVPDETLRFVASVGLVGAGVLLTAVELAWYPIWYPWLWTCGAIGSLIGLRQRSVDL
jgi:hypothetical protein